jgi:hypothetical protein
MRNRKKHSDEKQNYHRDNPQPEQHKLAIVLSWRRRRNAKYERKSSKNTCQPTDQICVFVHQRTEFAAKLRRRMALYYDANPTMSPQRMSPRR